MRKTFSRLLAVSVSILMIFTVAFTTIVQGEEQKVKVAKFTEAKFQRLASYSVGGENRGECLVITLKTDGEIYLGAESYWYKNLQQNGGGCTDEHKDRANIIRQAISINGKTIDADLTAGTDHTNSTMVSTASPNILRIHVRTAENLYGLALGSNFTVNITEGIELNGYLINPVSIVYNATSNTFEIDNKKYEPGGSDTQNEAVLQSAAVSTVSEPCNAGHGGEQWAVDMYFSKSVFMDTNDVANYYRKHLSVTAATSANGNTTVGAELLKCIYINDKTLAELQDKSTMGEYKAFHVQAIDGEKTYLRLLIPKNNDFGFDGDGSFSVSISGKTKLNGYKCAPKTVTVQKAPAGTYSVVPDTVTTAPEDTATVQRVDFQYKTSIYCSSHPEVPSPHIIANVYFDKRIYQTFPSSESYWNRHLHMASGVTDSMMANILFNDKTLAQCVDLESTPHENETSKRNSYNAFHIQTAGGGGEVLQIAIPVDNAYGVDYTKSFTIKIKDGILLNNLTLSPCTITYLPNIKVDIKITDFSEKLDPGEDDPSGTNVVSAKVTSVPQDFCNSHGVSGAAVPQWVVDIEFDKDIYDSTIASYYTRHLQQSQWTSEKTSGYDILRSSILLNGKNLDTCYSLSTNQTDYAQYLHLQMVSGKKILRIAIPTNNQYLFNGNSNFEIILRKGMTLNGIPVNARKITYNSSKKTFEIEKYVEDNKYSDPEAVHVTRGFLSSAGSSFCSSHDDGDMWVVDLYTDKEITPPTSDVASFYQRHLAVNEATSTTNGTTVGGAVRKGILINGKSLNICLAESGINIYDAFHIQVLENSSNQHYIRLGIPKSNAFGFDGNSDFTVTLRNTLKFNGYSVSSQKISYNHTDKTFTVEPYEDTEVDTDYFVFVKAAADETGSEIMLWPSGVSRYCDFILSDYLSGTSKNSEAFTDAHGKSCRECIYVDGMSVSEWINYGAGNVYQIMIRFENNYIRFLNDGANEPGLMADEAHWVEFKEGLISAKGEKIAPCKLFYDPNTKKWSKVETFEGLEKPWWITNYEEKCEFAKKKQENDPNYVLPQIDWDDKELTFAEAENAFAIADESEFDYDELYWDDEEELEDEAPTVKKRRKMVVVKRKGRPVIYEEYFPDWAIVLIVVGSVLVVAGIAVFVIIKRKKRKI